MKWKARICESLTITTPNLSGVWNQIAICPENDFSLRSIKMIYFASCLILRRAFIVCLIQQLWKFTQVEFQSNLWDLTGRPSWLTAAGTWL